MVIEVESSQKGSEALVPVREDGGSDTVVMEGFQGREDIGVDAPGIAFRESGIEVGKEGLAWRNRDEAVEHLVNEF
jgi:hypothetical protein